MIFTTTFSDLSSKSSSLLAILTTADPLDDSETFHCMPSVSGPKAPFAVFAECLSFPDCCEASLSSAAATALASSASWLDGLLAAAAAAAVEELEPVSPLSVLVLLVLPDESLPLS